MWSARRERLPGGAGDQLIFTVSDQPMTYRHVLHSWRAEPGFRTFFRRQLTDTPFTAYRWETPAITQHTVERPFACVLLDSPELARAPDAEAFSEHFVSASDEDRRAGVTAFANLRGDALMVVPHPLAEPAVYGHLAAFLRGAPDEQVHALWQRIGHAVQERLSTRPLWLNTAGAGVSWLHVRLDSRPKYYRHQPYRTL